MACVSFVKTRQFKRHICQRTKINVFGENVKNKMAVWPGDFIDPPVQKSYGEFDWQGGLVGSYALAVGWGENAVRRTCRRLLLPSHSVIASRRLNNVRSGSPAGLHWPGSRDSAQFVRTKTTFILQSFSKQNLERYPMLRKCFANRLSCILSIRAETGAGFYHSLIESPLSCHQPAPDVIRQAISIARFFRHDISDTCVCNFFY